MDSLKKKLAPSKDLSLKVVESLNLRTIEVAIKAAASNNIDLFISTNKQLSEKIPSVFQKHLSSFKEVIYQKGRNFHEKYLSTLDYVNKQNYDKIIVIGNDTPHLNSNIIQNAFNKLDNNDVVIGPSNDGGFYLHGFTEFNRELFNGIPWSTKFVANKLIQNIHNCKLKLKLLVKLDDIDSFRILKEFSKRYTEFTKEYFIHLALFCKIKICCLEQKFLMKTNFFTLITNFQLPPPIHSNLI